MNPCCMSVGWSTSCAPRLVAQESIRAKYLSREIEVDFGVGFWNIRGGTQGDKATNELSDKKAAYYYGADRM